MPRFEYQGWDVTYFAEPADPVLHVVAIDDKKVTGDRPLWPALNEAGWLGWELVSAVREPGENVYYTLFLKRQIPE